MGVTTPVSEILLSSKTAKFPFLTMDYSPWSSKNSMDRNQFKKFMQVGIDVKCLHTNFGGCDLYGFGDTATFKNGQISLSDHGQEVWIQSARALRAVRVSFTQYLLYSLQVSVAMLYYSIVMVSIGSLSTGSPSVSSFSSGECGNAIL